jgi:NAD(P)-dependent dehydrogenase (short-subunit alcohol dehydrogenase family)
MELKGRVAIVSGAASGIGKAIAAELHAGGASVIIADLVLCTTTAEELGADGGARVIALEADVTSPEQVESVAAFALETFGSIDILINNAALFSTVRRGPFEEITIEEWRAVFEVNVIGTALFTKAVVVPMRHQGGGRIINIASDTVFLGVPHMLHYVASKGAIVALTRALAKELGASGILVNALAPGFTLSEGVLAHSDHFSSPIETAHLGRALTRHEVPSDLAGAVRFLVGPAAAFITGQTLVVDGGLALH